MRKTIKLIEHDINDLKSCPCCGGKAEYMIGEAEVFSKGFINQPVFVRCGTCDLKTHVCSTQYRIDMTNGSLEILNDGVAAATKAWNKRKG